MKREIEKLLIVCFLIVVSVTASQSNAAIVSVAGPPSSAGLPPAIIGAPPNALNSVAFNLGMEGFNEAQGVVTSVAHVTDGGHIPAGAFVDSHMIFLNKPDDRPGGLSHIRVVWTFDGLIVGVMSDRNGVFEAASTFELGNPATNYTVGPPSQVAPYPARGMEGGDSYIVAGNSIVVNMGVSQPGDWIRVVTLAHIDVAVDIKPRSCPNPLNVKSKGVLPVAILGTEDFDVLDIASALLEGVAPVDLAYEDVSTPFHGELCDCHEAGPDGYLDLVLHFDTQEIVSALGPVTNGDVLLLMLEGEDVNGFPIMGSDCVRIVEKGHN